MDTGVSIFIQVIGTLFSIGFSAWLVIKYLILQIEKERKAREMADTKERGERELADRDLHGRVSDVKDTYVRRDDLFQHIQRIEKGMTDLAASTARQHETLAKSIDRVHSRLDNFNVMREKTNDV